MTTARDTQLIPTANEEDPRLAEVARTLHFNEITAVAFDHEFEMDTALLEELEPYLLWLHAAVLENKLSLFQLLFVFLAFVLSTVSTISAYPLGTDFVAKVSNDDQHWIVALFGVICGILSYLPTVTLIGPSILIELINLAGWLERQPQLATQRDRIILRNTALALRQMSLVGGIPFLALLIPYSPEILGLNVIVPGTALVATYFACNNVIAGYVRNYFVRTSPEQGQVVEKRAELVSQAQATIQKINLLSDAEVVVLHAQILEDIRGAKQKTQILAVLEKLLTLGKDVVPVVGSEDSRVSARLKLAFGAAAFIVGSYSTVVFFDPGVLGSQILINWGAATANAIFGWGMPSEQQILVSSWCLSGAAVVMNCAFDGSFAKISMDRAFDAYKRGERVPGAKTALAIFLAISASTPSAYLSLYEAANASQALAVIPTFVGATLARATGCDYSLEIIHDLYDKTSPRRLRKNLMSMMDKITSSFQVMSSELMMGLSQARAPVRMAPHAVMFQPAEVVADAQQDEEIEMMSVVRPTSAQ